MKYLKGNKIWYPADPGYGYHGEWLTVMEDGPNEAGVLKCESPNGGDYCHAYVDPDTGQIVHQIVVPWPMVNGVEVTTNGVTEDALGLTGIIGGWGREGFYTYGSRGVTKAQLKAVIETIDWERVLQVKSQFDIKSDGSYCVYRDDRVYWVTMRRYQRLMRQCLKNVPVGKFQIEIERAIQTTLGKR
mgnify:CR=1 FL=1